MPSCWYHTKNCLRSKCLRREGAVGGKVTEMANMVKGSKYKWTSRSQLVHLQTYMPLWMLIDFVEQTRSKRFFSRDDREEIRQLLSLLRKNAPFSENKRFPEECWVNVSVGPTAEAIDLLQRSFDIPEDVKEEQSPEPQAHKPEQDKLKHLQQQQQPQQQSPQRPQQLQEQKKIQEYEQTQAHHLKICKDIYDKAMSDLRHNAYLIDPTQLAKVGIYNRVTFEEHFGMQWTDKKHPNTENL